MISDILKIGDKIQLLRLNDRKDEKSYPSQILDIIDDDTLVISGPIHKSNFVLIHINDKVRIICTVENKGRYTFDAEVIKVEHEGVYKLKVKRITDIAKYQLRQYFRLNISIPVTKYFVIKNEKGDKLLKENCRTKDISGGGLQLYSNYRHSVGDIIRCQFSLDGYIVDVDAEVVRIVKVDTFEFDYALGVKFINIISRDRDRIIQFIFDKQRKLRKKGMI